MTQEIPMPEQGVVFNEPPPYRLGPITAAINEAVATLAPHEHVAIVGVWNDHGSNAVLVAKVHEGERFNVKVLSWIGKEWDKGGLNYGWAVRVAM